MQSIKKTYTTPEINAINVFSDQLMQYASGVEGAEQVLNKGTSFDTWDDEDDEDEGDLEILSRSDKVLKLFEDSPYN
ncbi:MAG: hypothetical protein PUF55_04340 [Bacteroidales bacterium]|nr:hypothetical protein [Bacteroidales bacterium]